MPSVGLVVVAVLQSALVPIAHAQWSVTNLNPGGAALSFGYAADGGQQAGTAFVDGVQRASLWAGTAGSWVDLHTVLPAEFRDSFARGISSDGVNMYIFGWGFNNATGTNEALLWSRPIPAPGAIAVLGVGGLLAARRRR